MKKINIQHCQCHDEDMSLFILVKISIIWSPLYKLQILDDCQSIGAFRSQVMAKKTYNRLESFAVLRLTMKEKDAPFIAG